ncbi:hypothetical protein [Halomonas sp. PGE1]|uniref:hypothetical protein n=1 Tax=Halomonas sp. PGE1 TaxID=2730360 RepID=UPI001473C564|nr:hypothetical protein [Halomonas sp. PGE1]QJQ99352.1 hypothetical protein HIR79_12050 [Halomonas sp. PGE1]
MRDNFSRRSAYRIAAWRLAAGVSIVSLPALSRAAFAAWLAWLSAEMRYHWGSSKTIRTKGACSRDSPPAVLRGDIAPLQAEIKQIKDQSLKRDDREET